MTEAPSAFLAAQQRARNDLAQLQGVWTSIAGQRPAELLIAGHLYTLKFNDGALYMGTFEIDADDEPRCMEMRIDEGPIKHKGLITLCLYELAGETLRWCPGQPGSQCRPDGFCSDEAERSLCLLFRREYPRFRA
jgi:uncharacterized protein (TIGR03067 family)